MRLHYIALPESKSQATRPLSTPQDEPWSAVGTSPDSSSEFCLLVNRIRHGDKGGELELYRMLSGRLKCFLGKAIGTDYAEDECHEVYMVMLRQIRSGNVREPKRLMGFIGTVMHRRIAKQIFLKIRSRLNVDVDCLDIVEPGPSPEEQSAKHQRYQKMIQVLDDMSSRDREMLSRYYLREQTEAEICIEMRLTSTQFRLLKSRAKGRFAHLGKSSLRCPSSPKVHRKVA